MKPFVKWAGGKKQILPLIVEKINGCISSSNRKDYVFIEPFVGGGVVFISLKNNRTIINDLNWELITAYRVIRDNPKALMKRLDVMFDEFTVHGEEYYKLIRGEDHEEGYRSFDDLHIASRMIFLNKTCFNGLYRVNSEGFFNTPMGRNKTRSFYDKKNIEQLSRFLNTIPEENIMNGSYKLAMRRAGIGDIIYVDPPYDYTENDGFTKYQKEGFTLEDLKELKEECDHALDSEAFVIISNNDTKAVREAFKNDTKHNYSFYYIEKLDTKRLINCKGNLRNTGKEILIVGVPCGFPQVKDVTKLLEYVRIKNEKDLNNEDYLLKRFKVTKLRITQILSTLQYFDIIDNNFGFTDKGKKLKKCSKKSLNREMKNVILEKPIFREVFDKDFLDTANKTDDGQIVEIIKRHSNNIKDGIALKRAKFVREIVDWCLAN